MKAIVIGVVALILMVGCTSTPTTQIAAFGESTNAITERVDEVFQEYNNAVLVRQFTANADSYRGAFAKKFSIDLLAKINRPVTVEQKTHMAVYRANKTLGAYAKALGALGRAGTQVDIDLASADLYGSLISFNDQYKIIKATDSDLFTRESLASIQTLVAAIGSVIVEEKRRAAIKEIVLKADPNISLICDVIISQLNESGIVQGISSSRLDVLDINLKEYQRLAEKTSSRLKWRTGEIKRLWELQQNLYSSKLLVQQSQKAILAVKTAHAVLAKEVAADNFSSATISAVIGRLKALNTHYNDFEKMLLDCGSVTKNDLGVLSCDD